MFGIGKVQEIVRGMVRVFRIEFHWNIFWLAWYVQNYRKTNNIKVKKWLIFKNITMYHDYFFYKVNSLYMILPLPIITDLFLFQMVFS